MTLVTSIVPPWAAHDPVDDGEPEAGALADVLVVKKGSKIRFCVSASMPWPVSAHAQADR